MSKFLPYWKESQQIPNFSLLGEEALVHPSTAPKGNNTADVCQPSDQDNPKKISPHDELVKFLIFLCMPVGPPIYMDYFTDYDQNGERIYWVNVAPFDWIDELLNICREGPFFDTKEWAKQCAKEDWDYQIAQVLADWAGKDPEKWEGKVLGAMDEANVENILQSLWHIEDDLCQQFLERAWEHLPELSELGFIHLIDALGSTSPDYRAKHLLLLKDQIDPAMKEAWRELNIFLPSVRP